MIQYTTPTLTFRVKGVDISAEQNVYISLKQGRKKLTKTDNFTMTFADDVTTILLDLSQEESSWFDLGSPVKCQINWIDSQGKRKATKPSKINVEENLLNEVIKNGSD